MKTFIPNYYPEFRCIADRCRHNCCLGWEIDIDRVTLPRYLSCSGTLGEKLRQNIEANPEGEDAPAHFKMTEAGRCPFLQENNLCQLILAKGEEFLCQICTDHPRFRNFWTGRTEIGLGLACEEACRIILSGYEKASLLMIADDGAEESVSAEERALFSLREELFAILQNRTVSTDRRILEMLSRCQYPSDGILFAPGPVNDIACEQLAVYLLYRHLADALYDGRVKDRIVFVAESYARVRNLWAENGQTEIEALIEPARVFSEEVEYDTETWQ